MLCLFCLESNCKNEQGLLASEHNFAAWVILYKCWLSKGQNLQGYQLLDGCRIVQDVLGTYFTIFPIRMNDLPLTPPLNLPITGV